MTATHIVCPHCDGINRVPAGKPMAAAKCGVCHKPLFTGHAVPVTADRFDKHIARNERVAGELEPAMRFLKLDTDRAPELSARYGIRRIPTTIVFRGGTEAARRTGAMDATTLRSWLGEVAPPTV